MGINGWIRWFERLAAGKQRERRQLIVYLVFIAIAFAISLVVKLMS